MLKALLIDLSKIAIILFCLWLLYTIIKYAMLWLGIPREQLFGYFLGLMLILMIIGGAIGLLYDKLRN